MTSLGFKERFVPAVEAGYWQSRGKPVDGIVGKKHSIRAGKARFKIGDNIQLYRRMRQKDMRKIIPTDPVCTKIQEIAILHSKSVIIDHRKLDGSEIDHLAKSDGFETADAFFDFFIVGDEPVFEGHIIYWDWP